MFLTHIAAALLQNMQLLIEGTFKSPGAYHVFYGEIDLKYIVVEFECIDNMYQSYNEHLVCFNFILVGRTLIEVQSKSIN